MLCSSSALKKPLRPSIEQLEPLGIIPTISQCTDIRSRVTMEILNTEKGYIHDMQLVIEGYLSKMEQLPNMKEEDVKTIFCNIRSIHRFHCNFMDNLELIHRLNGNIALAFLRKKNEWIELYTEYCSNNEKALSLVAHCNTQESMKAFLLGCKLLVSQEISLEGFLLSPVQRLCRYPLLLKVSYFSLVRNC